MCPAQVITISFSRAKHSDPGPGFDFADQGPRGRVRGEVAAVSRVRLQHEAGVDEHRLVAAPKGRG